MPSPSNPMGTHASVEGVIPTGGVVEPPVVGGPVRRPPRGGHATNSAFENAIEALSPIAWYQFREPHFNQRIKDTSGNNRHLLKQIAAATRSSVATRTTHPGGAYFPAVTYDNWATQGTFYKRAAESLLSGSSQYTLIMSMRMVARANAHDMKLFGVGTENTTQTATNDLIMSLDYQSANKYRSKRKSTTGLSSCDTDVTEIVRDGVNRLFITRFTAGSTFALTSSKPGNVNLAESTSTTTNNLDALNLATILNARTETSTGSNTTTGWVCDQLAIIGTDIGATAAGNLHTLWAAELGGYYPSMMLFDGSTGYYNDTSFTSTGSKVTATARFQRGTFTGDVSEHFIVIAGTTSLRLLVGAVSSNHSTVPNRQSKCQFLVQNSAGANICLLVSDVSILDDQPHVVFAAFDGDLGVATFTIDGVDADDTGNPDRVAPTTGTLSVGTAAGVGASNAGVSKFGGKLNQVGFRDVYLTNYADFGTGSAPAVIDEKTWAEWGAQPSLWSHTGQMSNNKGSAGDMTANGTITMTTGGSP